MPSIPEHFAHLVNPVQSSHDQTLQVQLVGNAQFHVQIQRIVMCFQKVLALAPPAMTVRIGVSTSR